MSYIKYKYSVKSELLTSSIVDGHLHQSQLSYYCCLLHAVAGSSSTLHTWKYTVEPRYLEPLKCRHLFQRTFCRAIITLEIGTCYYFVKVTGFLVPLVSELYKLYF